GRARPPPSARSAAACGRAGNPRLRASVTLVVLGAAAVAGAIASLTASGTTAVVVGFAAAALVLAAAIVLAGLLRRRAILLVVASTFVLATALVAAMLPPDREVLPIGSYGVSNYRSGDYAMLTGLLDITVVADAEDDAVIDVWQGQGDISIWPMEGATVRVEAVSDSGLLSVVSVMDQVRSSPEGVSVVDGRTVWTQTFGDPDAVPVVVRIEQTAGTITVHDQTTYFPAEHSAGTESTISPESAPTDPATNTTPQTTSEDAP
ncbi:hypothetical protein, partial [Rathayibacter sp. VKM Ac-2630]|uniref:hypothetical protein n=1 Tax=Rathayibacter sp. VKM Ac-2630 TaxID=1938617 RepID=UPI0009D139B4